MVAIDYIILAIVLVSAVTGLIQGFLREVCSLVSWVLAVWLAWKIGPSLEPHLGGVLRQAPYGLWAGRAIVFIIVLVHGRHHRLPSSTTSCACRFSAASTACWAFVLGRGARRGDCRRWSVHAGAGRPGSMARPGGRSSKPLPAVQPVASVAARAWPASTSPHAERTDG